MPAQQFSHRCTITGETALDALAAVSSLPKQRLKDAMNKGAVWLKRPGTHRRLRRATTPLLAGDELTLHYDAAVLALVPPTATLIADEKAYSVWNKPPGLLAQGTQSGDHCALLRIAEQQLQRECYLVHRLDREAEGLMMIAHTSKAAAALSALFAREGEDSIHKMYRVEAFSFAGMAARAGQQRSQSRTRYRPQAPDPPAFRRNRSSRAG